MSRLQKNKGMTLIELMITMIAISSLALVALPFVENARRMLRRAQVKQVCIAAVQNKLKDYRSSRLWGIESGENLAPFTSATSTGPYFSNSTFNWLKARYNLIADTAGSCIDLTKIANPPPPGINVYGLQEYIDSHGGPAIPAKACPEEHGHQCPGSAGPRDTLMQNQLGGNPLVLFVNLQVVSRLPNPNPWSPTLTGLNGGQLADVYQNAKNQGDISPGGKCANYPPNPNPYDPTVFTSDSRYLQPQPTCPNSGTPSFFPYPFDQVGAGIRVIVTGAVLMPAGGLWGYTPDTPIPGGGNSNQEFMCQAEEVMAPEELMVRYYISTNSGIYDFHGGSQPGSQPILTNIYDPLHAGKTPSAIAVAPDNSSVYLVDATGSQLLRYLCPNGSSANGQLACNDNPSTWDLGGIGIHNITGIGIDFINFPDVIMVAANGGNDIRDIRFDPNVSGAICTVWPTSQRVWAQNISDQRIGSILTTPLNGLLLYDSSSHELVSPYSSNYTFFPFFSDEEIGEGKRDIPAISQ